MARASLREYEKKRDFRSTPEPRGRGKHAAKRAKKPIFVVQKHDASRLHYDLRLEVARALASWAVPKGPSLDPGEKRLAVHVEDHPLGYAEFEGIIPEKQYGAGSMIVWDRGTWTPEEKDPAGAIEKGRLSLRLDGERLRGGWTLTRMGGKRNEGKDNWLLIKHDDEHASRGKAITDRAVTSVESGRTVEEVAADQSPVAGDGPDIRKIAPGKKGTEDRGTRGPLSRAKGARKKAIPRSPRPQLATLAEHAPEGEAWVHEIKFDGYRLLGRRTGAGVRLLTRSGKDWTSRFPPIARALESLGAESFIVDGEATIVDEDGRTSFQQLQNAIKSRDFARLVFYAFDLLYLDGFDLSGSPLVERKARLAALLDGAPGVIRFSEHIRGQGPEVHANACRMHLEGIISKRADAAYIQKRSRSWLKIKCGSRQEFIVIGWTPPAGSRKHFGSLLLGAHDGDGRLVYTGRAGTGFTEETLASLKTRLDSLARKTCPADVPPTASERRGARWVTPELVAEIAFTEWTDDGRLRHPVFEGLRADKEADSVVIETTANEGHADAEKPASRAKRGGDAAEVAGVRLSSPDRVVYPDAGFTKLDIARYYESVADRMLPFIAGRPLSTVRCPTGRTGACFYQKHRGDTFDDPVGSITVKEKSGAAEYIAVSDVRGLITLVQFGVLEIHPWGAREDKLDRPDTLTFDLDPGEGVGFEMVRAAARHVRDVLAAEGLESFLKITGGKGLHVVVPIERRSSWVDAKAFCGLLAKRIAAEDPGSYTATASKAKRKGRVFIDYLRNSRGATSVAPYSTRARPGAPVALPIRWDELSRLDSASRYTVQNVGSRLSRLSRDPWEGYSDVRQRIPTNP